MIDVHLGQTNGYLVYDISLLRLDGKLQKMLVDPVNGQILHAENISAFNPVMIQPKFLPDLNPKINLPDAYGPLAKECPLICIWICNDNGICGCWWMYWCGSRLLLY